MAGFEDNVGFEFADEFWNEMEFSVCAVGDALFVGDDVMIAPFKKVVFAFVNKGVAVFFVDFKEGLNEVFGVGVNSGALVVDGVGEDEDVHGSM